MTETDRFDWYDNAEPLCGMVPLNWNGCPALVVPDPDSALGFSILDPNKGWTKLDIMKVLRSSVPITWKEYVDLEAPDLELRAKLVAQGMVDSINNAVTSLPPPPSAADLEKLKSMPKKYEIVDSDHGGNVTKIDVTVQDNGGLQVFDWSMGPAADLFYGEGRDVEHWLELTPEATRQLSVNLFGAWVDDPANMSAQHLSETYEGDSNAVNKIREFLDENGVPYEQHLWT